jgi:hypothetical protein
MARLAGKIQAKDPGMFTPEMSLLGAWQTPVEANPILERYPGDELRLQLQEMEGSCSEEIDFNEGTLW